MGANQTFFVNVYTYLSLNAHPSNVSVFQFVIYFAPESSFFIGQSILSVKFFFMFVSIFIADYITLFPPVLQTFNKLPLIDQLIINGNNRLARDESYSINESWKELG